MILANSSTLNMVQCQGNFDVGTNLFSWVSGKGNYRKNNTIKVFFIKNKPIKNSSLLVYNGKILKNEKEWFLVVYNYQFVQNTTYQFFKGTIVGNMTKQNKLLKFKNGGSILPLTVVVEEYSKKLSKNVKVYFDINLKSSRTNKYKPEFVAKITTVGSAVIVNYNLEQKIVNDKVIYNFDSYSSVEVIRGQNMLKSTYAWSLVDREMKSILRTEKENKQNVKRKSTTDSTSSSSGLRKTRKKYGI